MEDLKKHVQLMTFIKLGLTTTPPRAIVTKIKNPTPSPPSRNCDIILQKFLTKNDRFQLKFNKIERILYSKIGKIMIITMQMCYK